MEKKQKIILAVFIAIIITVVVIFVLFSKEKTKPNEIISRNNEPKQEQPIAKPITRDQNERSQVSNIARAFVEVYGTYTNTNNYENIQSLYSFMTDKIRNKYVDLIENYTGDDAYFSKSTEVLSATLTNYKAGDTTAIAIVSAIERVVNSNYKETISQKKYVVSLIKDFTNKWKVDEIKQQNE